MLEKLLCGSPVSARYFQMGGKVLSGNATVGHRDAALGAYGKLAVDTH